MSDLRDRAVALLKAAARRAEPDHLGRPRATAGEALEQDLGRRPYPEGARQLALSLCTPSGPAASPSLATRRRRPDLMTVRAGLDPLYPGEIACRLRLAARRLVAEPPTGARRGA